MKRTREALMCRHSGAGRNPRLMGTDLKSVPINPQTFPAGGRSYPAIVGPAPFMPMLLWVRGEPRLRTGTQNDDYGINSDFLRVDK